MDSSSLPLSCSKRSVLNNGQLEFIFSNCFERSVLNNGQFEFTFVMFQAVSPKQWTAWVYLLLFQVVSPKQWTTWVYLHFPKSVIPCFVRKRDVTQSFASLPMFIPRFLGIRNHLCDSPVYRNTEYQVSFPGSEVYSNSVFSSVIPSVSGPEMSPIKCLFLQTISLQIHSKFPYNYQHGSGQSFSPAKLQYPLTESDPFLQRI